MKHRWTLANALLIAMAAAWLYPFACILRYGEHLVAEPALPVLVAEIAIFVAIIAFAIYNLRRLW